MVLRDLAYVDPNDLGEFQVTAEALPCIVWTANVDGGVEWCADGFERYTGKGALGWDWLRSVHHDDQPTITRDWTHAITCETDLDAVVRLRGIDGKYRSFSVHARPFFGKNGVVTKWFGTITDIHDRQTAIEANDHVVDALMKGYLSKKWPEIPGLNFDTHYRAANVLERLGGDWYDIFKLPDGRIAFSLGDVCGHGIQAAVKMGEAKQAVFIGACLGDPAPMRVLEYANKVIFLNGDHVAITTALYGVIDTARRTVTYASAGHHPPILARANGEAEILPNHGFPLGVEEEMPPRIKTHEFSYEYGSTLVLYTDGLIEFDHDMVDGEKRLLAAATDSIMGKAEYPAQYIADHVLGDRAPSDDVVVLTISFHDR